MVVGLPMPRRLRALSALLHDTVDFVVDLVEAGHASSARHAMRVLTAVPALAGPARLAEEVRVAATALSLGSVRTVNRAAQALTELGIDAATGLGLLREGAPVEPIALRSDIMGSRAWLSDAALGALNGAVGDRLHQSGSALDLGFSLRSGDTHFPVKSSEPPPFSWPGPRVAVFVHGVSTTEWSWSWSAESFHGDPAACFGVLLERDVGLRPLYARYNSGRKIAENGRLLAIGLEKLFDQAPEGVEELVLVGHSMGGLVARSACAFAAKAGHGWLARVRRVFCITSPHQGAPLEKLGHAVTAMLGSIDAPGTLIPAAILARRSAGIRDLREGDIGDEAPVLPGVPHYFVSATITKDASHPAGWLLGDLLVRTVSASGPEGIELRVPVETAAVGGLLHQEVQNHPAVYALLRRACAGEPLAEPSATG